MATSTTAAHCGTARGLDGVIALDSSICFIDGRAGKLVYRGYDIRRLAGHVSFEEVAHLLWLGALPTSRERDGLSSCLCSERVLPPLVLSILELMPRDASPMAVLRTCVSALAHADQEADDMSAAANMRKSVRLAARMPVIIAAFARLRTGREPIEPLTDGSTAANFLYMLTGERPAPHAERTLDTALVLHAEHSLNASTFAGRVIGSTLSDLYAAVSGAVGALAGALHGGANVRVMKMLKAIDASGESPASWVRRRLARRERIMGFGHRVYKVIDPRASILRGMMQDLAKEQDTSKWERICEEILEVMRQEKGLAPNVDYYTAPMYYMLGIDADLYTPIFAMSRITGWTAHLMEQWHANRLIRPLARYTGLHDLHVVPISDRRVSVP